MLYFQHKFVVTMHKSPHIVSIHADTSNLSPESQFLFSKTHDDNLQPGSSTVHAKHHRVTSMTESLSPRSASLIRLAPNYNMSNESRFITSPYATESNPFADVPLQRNNGALTCVRLCTFNVENLFSRFDFSKDKTRDTFKDDGFTMNDLAFGIIDEESKRITGACLRATQADILCLQEVESGILLDRFRNRFLSNLGYRYSVVLESHDSRFINVGVLSRYPIVHIRSHKDDWNQTNSGFVFSRDCLEVDVQIGCSLLTIYVNHLRAMLGGRSATHEKRRLQVNRILEIVEERWKSSGFAGNFVIVGDMNDYNDKDSALMPLLKCPYLENVVERLPQSEQWTHHYSKENICNQLDYIFVSRFLSENAANKDTLPIIERRGLPKRCKANEIRFPGVGVDRPKASDHCPVIMDLLLEPISHLQTLMEMNEVKETSFDKNM